MKSKGGILFLLLLCVCVFTNFPIYPPPPGLAQSFTPMLAAISQMPFTNDKSALQTDLAKNSRNVTSCVRVGEGVVALLHLYYTYIMIYYSIIYTDVKIGVSGG